MWWLAAFVAGASGSGWWALALSAGSLGYLRGAFALTAPLAKRLPASCQTVGELSRIAMISRFKAAPAQAVSAKDGEIWTALQALIADELGVPPEKVTPNTDWVRDLGVG